METLQKQVRRAWWRLLAQRFVTVLGWSLFAAFTIAALAIVLPKLLHISVASGNLWGIAWLGTALCLGVLASCAWVYWTRKNQLDAAIELDRRFKLQERVSSTLALPKELRETAFGQALVSDAQREVERVDVRQAFGIRLSRKSLLPVVPMTIAVLVMLFAPDRAATLAQATSTNTPSEQIEAEIKSLGAMLQQQQQLAEEADQQEALELLQQLELELQKLAEQQQLSPQEALAELNDLTQELEKRREALGDQEQLRKQLEQLRKTPQASPTNPLNNALQKADFDRALQELDKLAEKLNSENLTDEEREALQQDLAQLQEQIRQMAEAQKEAMEQLQQQIDSLREQGKHVEADQLEQRQRQLQSQAQNMQSMQEFSDQMCEAGQCSGSGDQQGMQDALAKSRSALERMRDSQRQAKTLRDTSENLAKAREAISKSGTKQVAVAPPSNSGEASQAGGSGLKPGQGSRALGEAPEPELETKTENAFAPQQQVESPLIVTDEVDGPNRKGSVQQQIQRSFQSGAHDVKSNPINNQRLPKTQQNHVQEYFDSLRTGE